MAFIQTSKFPEDFIGKECTLKRDCTAIKGTITKGSKVIVTGVSARGFDIKDIESGEKLIECGYDCLEEF